MNIDIDRRKDFYGNIVVNGGVARTTDFFDRLHQGMVCLAPASMKIKVVGIAREESVWIGGSILASLSTFNHSYWITRDLYHEYGSGVAQVLQGSAL